MTTRYAIVEPARRVGVSWSPEAADMIVATTRGYPGHLQLFAGETWMIAGTPRRITVEDARAGVDAGQRRLERESLRLRFDSLQDRERELLTALAAHGGEAPTAALARTLDRTQQARSRVRDALVTEGDVYPPRRGMLALSMPAFAPYLLSNYEAARRGSSLDLLALEQMRENMGPAPSP